MRSVARRLLLALVAALSTTLLLSAPAHAHAELRSISPADTSTLTSAPNQIVMTFNEDIGEVGAAVEVVDGEGVSIVDGDPVISGTTVTQPLQATLHSGAFQVSFRVVSADGHPVSGTSTFTLALPTASPTTAPTPSEPVASTTSEPEPTMTALNEAPSTTAAAGSAATSTAGESASGSNAGLISGVIAAVVALAGGIGFAARRRGAGPDPSH